MRRTSIAVGLAIAVLTGWPVAAQELVTEEELEEAEPQIIRFVTDTDYPPFHYFDEEGVLTGFNIDVARAICLELDVVCDVAERQWDDLLPALRLGEADAAIASIAVTPQTIQQASFTDPYYFTPGRFIGQRNMPEREITPEGLEGIRIGVVRGTAHEAFLRAYFADSIIEVFQTADDARQAIMKADIPYLFGDGIGLTFWLNGTASQSCCAFKGEAYAEPFYFGPGVGIAVQRGNHPMRQRLNRAISAIRTSGRLEELFFRYFPLRVY